MFTAKNLLPAVLTLAAFTSCARDYKTQQSGTKDAAQDVTIGYVGLGEGSADLDCSGLGLSGPSCNDVSHVTDILGNITEISSGAILACAAIPDLTASKALMLGFGVIGAQSKFLSFVLKNIPCEATISEEQKALISDQVKAILQQHNVIIDGPITIPSTH